MTDQASTKDELTTTSKATRGGGVAGRSRRQLLAGGTGALAAVLTAEALARPAPAAAANGDPIVLGQNNAETSVTTIANSTADSAALRCTAAGNAIEASSDSFNAVFALSNSGTGVAAQSSSSSAIFGDSGSGTGVVGHSTSGTGVSGQSALGEGVSGESSGSGSAVHGTNFGSGTGVMGECAAGTGVLASGKTALKVKGPAVFSRSGILTVAAGQSSAQKTGIALTPVSFVLATIQGNVAGVHVQGVTLVTGSPGSFTIHLNKSVPAKTKVAWFAVN